MERRHNDNCKSVILHFVQHIPNLLNGGLMLEYNLQVAMVIAILRFERQN